MALMQNPSLPGQGAATSTDLFVKVYGGMLISAFEELAVTQGRFMERTTQGLGAQFPVFGRTSGKVHAVNESIYTESGYGGQVPQTERIIQLDRPYLSVLKVDEFEANRAHYPFMAEYAHTQAEHLAEYFDNKVLRALAIGALQTETLAGLGSGINIAAGTGFASGTTAADINNTVAAFFDAKNGLDIRRVPPTGRVAYMGWAVYNYLTKYAANQVINLDITGGAANGSVSTGTVKMFAGFILMPTNHFTWSNAANIAALTGVTTSDVPTGPTFDNYAVPTTKIEVLFGHPSGVGCVTLEGFGGLRVKSWYEEEYQQRILFSSKAHAAQYLRPEACGMIRSAT